MGKNRRVVITGMGAITPIGNSVEEFWNGIKEGKTGFGPITYFDTADSHVNVQHSSPHLLTPHFSP